MATSLAQVRVTKVEAGNGFAVHCNQCGTVAIRDTRITADAIAVDHARTHVVPDPADQVWEF
jgi:hypothetical protein